MSILTPTRSPFRVVCFCEPETLALPRAELDRYAVTRAIEDLPSLDTAQPRPTVITVRPLSAEHEGLLTGPWGRVTADERWELFATHVVSIDGVKLTRDKNNNDRLADEWREKIKRDVRDEIVTVVVASASCGGGDGDRPFSPPAGWPYIWNQEAERRARAAVSAAVECPASDSSTETSQTSD